MSITRRHLLWLVPAVVAAAGGLGMAAMTMHGTPADLDLALSRPTEAGLYRATLTPGAEPVPVGPIHSWTLTVETPDGTPVDGATIAIEGGMPQHGHGLPTAPRVTRALGDGGYLIEGVKFNMGGWWTLTVRIDAAAGSDQVTFNLSL